MVSLVLVENEFVIAEDIPSRLRAAGFDILGTPATGKDAIAQARKLRPDVVLMDVVLKGKMDGIEAAQQITERFDIPVIFLTAHTDAATVKRAAATTSYGFLIKPFDDLELSAAIEMAIRRRSMEAKMRESDHRIRELTESLSEVIFETDMAGNITFINRAGLNEFGYTQEQVEGGMTLYDFLPPEKHEEIRETIAQAVIDEPSEWIEVPALRCDGTTFPASVRASVIVREGVPAGIRGIAVNVTEQKRAEQQLEESEQRFRALFESSPVMQIRYDVDGYPGYVNRAALEFLGVADVADIQHVSVFSSSRVTGANKAQLRAGHTVRYEQRYDFDEIKKRGDFPTTRSGIRFVDFHLAPLFEVGTGKVEGYLGQVADITERKRAEQELEESERHVRDFAQMLPELAFEIDTKGKLVFVNDGVLATLGTSREKLTKTNVLSFIAPEDRKRAREEMQRTLRGEKEKVSGIEYSGVRADGSTFPLLIYTTAMRRDDATVGIRGVAVDITEQKRADQKLEESEKRIRELTDALPEIIFETDANGTVTFANATPFIRYGYTKEEVEGKMNFLDVIAPFERERARGNLGKIIEGEDKGWIEYDLIKKNGGTAPWAVRTMPIVRDGVLEGLRGIAIDITERKRAEAALISSERRIRELTDALPEIIFETDANGIITFANATAFTRYGWTIEEIEGKLNFLDVVAPFDRERARETNSKRIQGEDTGWVEYDLITKDGSTVPFDVRTTPIVRDGVYKGLRGIAIDITERKQFEDELTHERDQAERYLDTADVIMMALNLEGRITMLNRKGCELLGVTGEQAVGTDWFETFLPEDARTETWRIFNSLITGEDTYVYLENIVLSRGEKRLVAWHTSLLKDDTGTIIGTLSSGTDVTERVRADQKLHESERRIRELTNALPVVVYEADATGRITFANATAFDLFGYTKEEVEAGISVFQLIAPADLKRARAVFPRRMSGEDVGRVEYAGLRKDGSTFNMAARSALMRRDGAVVGQRGVLVDITERKRAEERVKEHTHTIETLNRIMTEGNRATDVQSFVEAATKLACELMHFDIGGIYFIDDARYATLQYGQGLPETARDAIEKIPYHDAPFSAVLIDGDPLFAEDYVTFLPQHAPLGVASLASVPLYSRDTIIGALNVGSVMRHTFSQTEKALLVAIGNEAGTVIAKLQADASVRAALKEKETLLKEIHHRVKNNMQVVSSLMSLQADRATNVEAQAVLTASQSQIRSMALIHEKLYSSGTLSEIEFADYVGSLIKELLQMYHVAPDAVTITTDIEDVRFGVDIAMPCALILNELVSNCLKYAFPDGRVGEVIVGMQYADGTYTLTVADNGVGFPADVDFRATGSLGMQLVTALVDQLDGTIDMNRENGTSFVISFSPPP
jgi:PAS domain S-box-containing protein